MAGSNAAGRRPGSLDELLQAATGAALTVSGADRSNWTGQLQNARHVRGLPDAGDASRPGLRLDYQYVMAPLRELYAVPGAQHDAEQLLRYRRAVETLFHEHVHLLSAHGTDHTGVEPYMRPAEVNALEEGVTEAYAFANVDRFIDVLGIEDVAPGITALPVADDLTPEATVLALLAGQVSPQLSGDEVLRQLAVVNPRDKWATLALIISDDSSPETRQRVGQVMWRTYAEAPKDPATATRTLQVARAELRK